MKKIFLVFTIIISFFIFDSSFKEKSEYEYARKKSLAFSLNETSNFKTTEVEFNLKGKDKDVFFAELLSFLKENKYFASFIEKINASEFEKKENWYVYFENEEISKDVFSIRENTHLDFTQKNSQYYTTNIDDKKSEYHINYLDAAYSDPFYGSINVYSLENYKNTSKFKSEDILFMSFHTKDINALMENVNASTLTDYISNEGGFAPLSSLERDASTDPLMSFKIITIISLALLLLMICYVVKVRKEIMLRKMYGMSDGYILKKLFLKEVVYLCLVYTLTNGVAYVIYVGNLYVNSVAFLVNLCTYFAFFILMMVGVLLVVYITIKSLGNISVMKKEKDISKFLKLNFILKTIAILLLMQPCIMQGIAAFESTSTYLFLEDHKEKITQSIYLHALSGALSIQESDDARQKIFDYYDTHGGYFQDFNSYYLSSEMQSQMGATIYPYPYLEANVNYLEEYALFDEEEQRIDLKEIRQGTLLIPQEYKEKDLSAYEGEDKIYIKNGEKFYSNSVALDARIATLNNPIIKVHTTIPLNHPMIFSYNVAMLPLVNEKEVEDFNQFLKQEELSEFVDYSRNSDDYKLVLNGMKNKMVQSWVMIFIQILAISIFLFETIYLFIIQEKRAYSLRYLFGESFLERYGNLFIVNASIYSIVLVVGLILGIPLSEIFMFLIPTAIFEMILSYAMIKRFEHQSVVSTLKGE